MALLVCLLLICFKIVREQLFRSCKVAILVSISFHIVSLWANLHSWIACEQTHHILMPLPYTLSSLAALLSIKFLLASIVDRKSLVLRESSMNGVSLAHRSENVILVHMSIYQRINSEMQ